MLLWLLACAGDGSDADRSGRGDGDDTAAETGRRDTARSDTADPGAGDTGTPDSVDSAGGDSVGDPETGAPDSGGGDSGGSPGDSAETGAADPGADTAGVDTGDADTARPDSSADTARPDSSGDTPRPDSSGDTARPDSSGDTAPAESGPDSAAPSGADSDPVGSSDTAGLETGELDTAGPDTGEADTAEETSVPDDSTDTGSVATDADGDGLGAAADCDDADTGVGAPTVERFAGWETAAVGTFPYATATEVVDLDGDGILDIATCRDTLVWLTNADGAWADEDGRSYTYSQVTIGDYCRDLEPLDVDDDGDTDMLVVTDGNALLWFEQDGGSFLAPQTFLSSGAGNQVVAGDFDGDGHTDLAAGQVVGWNDGGGSFTSGTNPCGTRGDVAGALPLLGDGRSVLVCRSGGNYLADGSRTFSRVPYDPECTGSGGLTQGPDRVADFDGDGAADTLFSGVDLCYGDGTGALSLGDHLAEPEGWITTLTDADGDGWTDLVLNVEGAREGGDLRLYRGDGVGFTAVDTVWVTDGGMDEGGGALWEDLDGDGVVDLLGWSDEIYQFVPEGDGFESPWSTWFTGGNLELQLADLDGDGALDIVGVGGGSARVWWGDGAGEWTGGDVLATYTDYADTTVAEGGADLDGDGDDELVFIDDYPFVLDWDGSTLTVTEQAVDYAADSSAGDLFSAGFDLDGDGDDETLFANRIGEGRTDLDGDGVVEGAGGVRVAGIAQAGLSTRWVDLVELTGAARALATSVEDFDGDGALEVAILDEAGLRLWAWDGTELVMAVGTDVAWATSASEVDSWRAMGAADADADGDLDLWFPLYDEDAVQVLLNDGTGAFSLGDRLATPERMPEAERLRFVALGPSGIEAWSLRSGTVSAWRSTSAGFESLGDAEVYIHYGFVADMDGDGAAELIGNYGGKIFSWPGTLELACE